MTNYSHQLVLRRIRSLRRKQFVVEDKNGDAVYFVKEETTSTARTFRIFNMVGERLAKIKQCVSPGLLKYRIEIENVSPFFLRKKFSVKPNYAVAGKPWEVKGDFSEMFTYQISDQEGKDILKAYRSPDCWDDRYFLKLFDASHEICGVCLAIAIDASVCEDCGN